MDGEKKYSPPFDTTHSTGRSSLPAGSLALVRMMFLSPLSGDAWPMMGSKPGPTVEVKPGFGFPGVSRNGKVVLLAQSTGMLVSMYQARGCGRINFSG